MGSASNQDSKKTFLTIRALQVPSHIVERQGSSRDRCGCEHIVRISNTETYVKMRRFISSVAARSGIIGTPQGYLEGGGIAQP